MTCYLENIRKAYDNGILQEHSRLQNDAGKQELEKIISAFLQYSYDAESVLDIGCGTGTYANILSQKGYKISCVDISPKSIEFLIQHYQHQNIMFGKVGSASNLEQLNLKKYNAILLLGPMYHIIEHNERQKALQNCWNHLNDGGVIYIMYLNTLPNWEKNQLEIHHLYDVEQVENGWITWTNYQGQDIPQFRSTIQQAQNEISDFFNLLEIIGIPDENSPEQFCIVARKKL